jgi:hypothetical protein
MNSRRPITRGADISIFVIIVGLYLGLFLTKHVDQNEQFTDASGK